MEKLTEILHAVVSGVSGLTDNRAGELHDLVDELGAELEGKIEAKIEATVSAAVGNAFKAAATETTAAPAEPAAPATETPGDGAAGA